MRILYLAADAVPSPKGAGVRIRRTVETLRSLGHEVELFTPAGTRDDEFPHDTVKLDEPNFLRRMLAFRAASRDWMRSRSADAIQFRSIFEGAAAVEHAERRGAKLIYEAHGFPSIELPYHYPTLDRDAPVLEKLICEEQGVLARADVVLTPSRTGRRFLLMRGVPPDRIRVVGNVVDSELFVPPLVVPTDAPPFRLVYVGTLSPWQGLPTLLDALAMLRRRALVELHVIGPAKSLWRRELRRQARRLRVGKEVHWSGAMRQEDLLPVLQTSHLCVAPLPSDPRNVAQGCCPLKVLEYMAAGRPILASRIPPVQELLDDGETAKLVGPSSASLLAEGVEWMLDHAEERERMAMSARSVAVERYSPQRFVDALKEGIAAIGDGSSF